MQPEQEMQTAKEKGYAEDERWHQRRDGSKFYASGVMRAICNPELSGYVKIARDITQQKILEQQKDDFIAIASHELRTPLTGIKAYIEILHEMQQEGGTIEADLFKKLDDQVDRLIELVRSLLDTSKLAQGQLALSPENFNLNELVAERVQEMKLTTGIHKIKLASKGDAFVTADKKRIDEVLTNLISNAIKYSPKGGEIIIKLAKTTEGIQVSVRDNGMGVPEDLKNKIFDRFYRVRNAQVNTFPGLGLGLYIASIIIHQHGGRIWLDSTLNKGSTFYFLLPCS
jgi:signal transduction histidine kinase